MSFDPDTLGSFHASQTDQAYFVLAEFSQDDWSVPVVNNNEPITSNGKTYLPVRIALAMPDLRGGTPTAPQFEVSNIDPIIIAGFRQTVGAVDVTLQLIRAANPDTVLQGPYTMQLVAISYDTAAIRGTLIIAPLESKPLSHMTFSPSRFPGLFG